MALSGVNRRQFIKEACLFTVGTVGTLGHIAQGSQPVVAGNTVPGKMMYRRLGRTCIDISVVVAGEMDYSQMHERAYELGVNYWHKVGNFSHPGPEFFKDKDRESFVCDMVIDTLDKEGATAQFEWGLKQSGLEMIDFIKIHSLYREPKEIKKYSGIFKAYDELKKKGKVRFLALAQHGNTAEVCSAAIESGLFDAIQPNFNIFSRQDLHDMIGLAQKNDIGVICKKVLAGGDRNWQRNPGRKREVESRLGKSNYTVGQAMLKWALNVPGVTSVVPLVTTFAHLEEDIAVGFAEKDISQAQKTIHENALADFSESLSANYCRSCASCEKVCPNQIAIPDIFRYELYSISYGRPAQARDLYRKLPLGKTAEFCDGCGLCEKNCPHSLKIISKLGSVHNLLA